MDLALSTMPTERPGRLSRADRQFVRLRPGLPRQDLGSTSSAVQTGREGPRYVHTIFGIRVSTAIQQFGAPHAGRCHGAVRCEKTW